ncbi:MAG: SPOR domain-containing protein [Chitinispirillaceae bacterium]|nr:SPOR domain-containing protein [Chitinispirillaceae bacterium]
MNRTGLSVIAGVILFPFITTGVGAQGNSFVPTFLDTLNKGREVSLTDADFSSQTAAPAVSRAVVAPERVPPAPVAVPAPRKEAGVVPSRFKIQVLAGPNEQQIRQIKNALAPKIDLPLSVSFETPYYKLFAGDFSRHSEAESWCAQLKDMGYSDAWIVRTAASQKPR